jgi:hypothetical protein
MLAYKIQNFVGVIQQLPALAESVQRAGFNQRFPGFFVEVFGMGFYEEVLKGFKCF